MAFNGSGTFNLYTPGNPVVTGTTISSTWANNTLTDIATGLSTCITKDGQTTVTAAIPFANNRLTGIGAATSLTDAVRASQVQNSSLTYLTSVSGADTITATAAITPAAYATGQMFQFVAAGANTGAVTLDVSGLGAKDVTKNGSTALTAGDIPSGATISVMYDGTRFQLLTNNSENVDPLFLVPTGVILDFAGTVAPAGYLGCDGSNVSRTTYADLFAAIGTTWGVGDGSTTFGLPDMRRRVSVGSGGTGTGTLGNAVGNTGGAETHTLITSEMPAHTHTQDPATVTTPGAGGGGASPVFGSGGTTGSTGGDGAHNNMQPSAVVLKIIKT